MESREKLSGASVQYCSVPMHIYKLYRDTDGHGSASQGSVSIIILKNRWAQRASQFY